jgi:hypothetical protein
MSPRTYLSRLLFFTLFFALAVIVFNRLVDPYAIFGARRVAGFNQYKIDINDFTRLSKRYQPELEPHDALIVGNSRVELGINPAHRCFHQAGLRVYNLGLPGAGVQTQLAYALNIMYQQPVKQVFVSVDFTDFISKNPPSAPAAPSLMAQNRSQLRYLPDGDPNPDYLAILAADYYKSLFTLDALVSSVITVAGQSARAADRDETGFNPGRDFAEAVRVEGARALFVQKLDELQRKYSDQWYLRGVSGQLDPSFQDFSEFLAIAARRGVQVHLFTNPFHESYWQLMKQHGLMPLYQDWVESIEQLVLKHRAGSVSLWDFSGDSRFIHETVPAEDARSGPLEWFWEPAHYRQELGSLMVDAMLSGRCDSEIAFGQKLL